MSFDASPFETIVEVWPTVVAVAHTVLALILSIHVLMRKRDPSSVVGWVGVIWLSPFFGAFLYYLLGINRIRRKAVSLGVSERRVSPEPSVPAPRLVQQTPHLGARLPSELQPIAAFGTRVLNTPIVSGNRIQTLKNGDEAYPAMLEAIRGAEKSVSLATYIFDYDRVGRQFVEALKEAVERGVEVRVLVDAAGARYHWPSVYKYLRRFRIPSALFLRTLLPWSYTYMNLRNHRKLLIVDGETGFTGGMNIRKGHVLGDRPRRPIQDLQFLLEGPIVEQLQATFAQDWVFSTGEVLSGKRWFPDLSAQGEVPARGISDGPDEDFEAIKWIILGAVSNARNTVRIATPYFLPDRSIMTALSVAVLSGVDVEIVVPEENNQFLVHWAMMASVEHLLEQGVKIYLTPPPFDHSKFMTVDGGWVLIGSSNWDARSLRLNFEFNVEAYDKELAGSLDELVAEKKQEAKELRAVDLAGRAYPWKLRDSLSRLLSPYL